MILEDDRALSWAFRPELKMKDDRALFWAFRPELKMKHTLKKTLAFLSLEPRVTQV